MPVIGPTEQAVVLRTDFSDETAWRSACTEMLAETDEGFRAYVDVVEDPAFAELGVEAILAAVGDDYHWGFLIVADQTTMTDPEHSMLVLDLFHDRRRVFRALPGEIPSIENNLSIANMDFAEFANAVDDDNVFRGFDF